MTMSVLHRAAMHSWPREGARRAAKPRRYQRHELLAAASGAVLLAVIGALSGWAHHSLSTAPDTAAAPVQSRAATPPASSPTGVQLRAWLTEAEPSINAVLTARNEIASAAADDDIAATGAACRTADAAVVSLRQYLPSPEPALNVAFHEVIDGYGVGLRYCIAGTQTHDADDIAQAAVYIHRANVSLQKAVDILESGLPDARPGDPGVMTV